MIKRLALVTALAGAPLLGVLAPAAHADTTCNGVEVNVNATINGQVVAQDQCVPLGAPSLP